MIFTYGGDSIIFIIIKDKKAISIKDSFFFSMALFLFWFMGYVNAPVILTLCV